MRKSNFYFTHNKDFIILIYTFFSFSQLSRPNVSPPSPLHGHLSSRFIINKNTTFFMFDEKLIILYFMDELYNSEKYESFVILII